MHPTGMTPPGGMGHGDMSPAPAQPMMDPVMMFRRGIQNLSPEELQELDGLLTPRIAELLGKMFGPEMQQSLAPWIQARRLLAEEPGGTA